MTPHERRRLDAIQAHYKSLAEDMASTPANRWAVDPYAWHGLVRMTPIEEAMWTDIRCEGLVFYPQFPVGRFFVDFGNPQAKVAIECDGWEWHQDKDKDAERQAQIEALGWSVYRINGSSCKKADSYEEDEAGIERFEAGPARQLLRLIAELHGVALGRTTA